MRSQFPKNDTPPNHESFEVRRQRRWMKSAEVFEKSSSERAQFKRRVASGDSPRDQEKGTRVELREQLLEERDALGLERVLGKNNLLQINYLQRGIAAARSVCRVRIASGRAVPDGFGTGFLVAPSLLLTNEHVIPTAKIAENTTVEFNFEYNDEYQLEGSESFTLAPKRFFYANPELDFTLVAVQPISWGGKSLTEFGHIQLIEKSGKALASESVAIIQHPAGRDKYVSLRGSRLLAPFKDAVHFIHYDGDTLPGSSGSPVFSDQWKVVALHHSSVPKTRGGNILNRRGGVWKRGDDPEDIDWIANEGVRISSIFKDLTSRAENCEWSPSNIRVLEELAAASESSLNEKLADIASRCKPPTSVAAYKHPTEPARPLTVAAFEEKLKSSRLDEDNLAAYFDLSEESRGIDPLFALNRNLVISPLFEPAGEGDSEGSGTGQWTSSACWISRQSRYDDYQKRLQPNGSSAVVTRVLAVGDSWFQYPFRLYDVVDYLADRDDLAVLSYGEAGDQLRDVLSKTEFLTALARDRHDVFLLSAGFNDLLGGEGVRRFLKTPTTSFEPEKLIERTAFEQFRHRLASDLDSLFRIVTRTSPDTRILFHGYSYPVPDAGPWLGQPMRAMGIPDLALQRELARLLLDGLNETYRTVAESYPKSVGFLDLRDDVPAYGWFDESHPSDTFFGDIAQKFVEAIEGFGASEE